MDALIELSEEDLPLLGEVQRRASELGMPLPAAIKQAFIGWIKGQNESGSTAEPASPIPLR